MMVVDIWSPACKHWPTVLHSMTTKAESADLSKVVFVTINLGNVAEAVRLITEQDINPAHSRVSMCLLLLPCSQLRTFIIEARIVYMHVY